MPFGVLSGVDKVVEGNILVFWKYPNHSERQAKVSLCVKNQPDRSSHFDTMLAYDRQTLVGNACLNSSR